MTLSKEQIARYSRQLILPEIGVRGQQRLADASVLIVGAGGLGSPASLYLAAAGVGTIGIVDPDPVELSNLHRQILHSTADLNRPKVDSAADRLRALNPHVRVVPIRERATADNILAMLQPYELVLDGSDNFSTRYLVNDACVLAGKPLVHGGVVRLEGQVMAIRPRVSACYRCVFPEPPEPGAIPSCSEAGVVGPLVGTIGSMMAWQAMQLILNVGQPLLDRLLTVDGRLGRFREVPVRRDPACAVCGDQPSIDRPMLIAEAGHLACDERRT